MIRLFVHRTCLFSMLMLLLISCGKETKGTAGAIGMDMRERHQIEQEINGINTIDSLKNALANFRQTNQAYGQMMVYYRLAVLNRENSKYLEAVSNAQEGLKLSKAADDTLLTISFHNELGASYRRLGILDDAVENHMQAYVLNKQYHHRDSTEGQINRIMALSGLGNIAVMINDYELADDLLHKALAGEKLLGRKDGIAVNLANLGNVKEKKGELDSAWYYYRQSLKGHEACGNQQGVALCHNDFGRLYEQSNQLDKALSEYRTAIQLLEKIDDEWHRQESALDIVRIFIKKGDLESATTPLFFIHETARRMGALEHRIEAYHLGYELYLKKGNIQQAFDNYKAGNELEDSLLNMDKMRRIRNAHLSIEHQWLTDEITQSGVKLEQERHSKQMTRIVLGVMLTVALLCIFVLYYTLRQKVAHQQMVKTISNAKEQFFTHITHEFRTPLTVILGLGHQLEDQEEGDMAKVHSAAKMIVRQGNSLLDLINQLLDISKVSSATGTPQWRRGNIVAFVEMILENFYPYAASKCIELSYSHSLTKIEMDFAPEYIQKIVSNLVGNAIKFCSNYAKVNVTVEQTSDNCLKLQVFDTGCGISPESLPYVFDMFYQGTSERTNVGTGIGLSLAKLMTEAMNGTITVESIEGQGSTFTVLLPLKHEGSVQPLDEDSSSHEENVVGEADDAAQVEGTAPLTDTRNSKAKSDAPLILIVEDNKDIAYYISSHLQQYRQHFAQNAEEALKSALQSVPDLIITDVMMPGRKNGLDLCRDIRSSEVLNHVPIIIITAKTSEADRVKGLEAGADVYLVKPFNSEELLVRIDRLLERQRQLRKKYASLIDGEPGERVLSAEDQKFMNKIIDNIYSLMSQGKVDVESLAGKMALSRSQLNRRVLTITGQNTSMLMMRVRLSYAKRLLKADPSKSVGEIAMKCGFDDLAYFSRIFKQAFDMTPSQYRKQY